MSHAHAGTGPGAHSAPAPSRRAVLDAVLRPFVLGTSPAGTGGQMTVRRVAAAARDAAAAALPVLGEPRPSAHRVRRLVTPVLTCPWAEFEAAYSAALDAILALPPAIPGVDDPDWDSGLGAEPPVRRSWLERGQRWTPPVEGVETVAPGGTAGRVVRRGARAVLVTADGRPVRLRGRCECATAERRARPPVPFEHVHLRRDGSILDVTAGTACGACRAPVD